MHWRSSLAAFGLGALLGCGAGLAQAPSDDALAARRMMEICDASLDVRISYEMAGLPLEDAVGGTAFMHGPLHDYLLFGVPYTLPPDAEIQARLGDTPLEIVDRLFAYLVLARVPTGTIPLVTDTVPSTYADQMVMPKEFSDACDALGAAVRNRPIPVLSAQEEGTAVECEFAQAYRGPTTGFACRIGEMPWTFLRVWSVERTLTDGHMYPLRYIATSFGDAMGGQWSRPIGLPVFAPDESDNPMFAFIANTRWSPEMRQWELILVPAETVMPVAQDYASHAEKAALALRRP